MRGCSRGRVWVREGVVNVGRGLVGRGYVRVWSVEGVAVVGRGYGRV